MSDQPEYFQTSDLSVPTETVEGWHKLGNQMQPSTGAGSAPVSKNEDAHDAQWLRKISVAVYAATGGDKADGMELSALRVNFNIKAATTETPATLWCRIYNMAPSTMAKVIQHTRIQVKAGYRFAGYGLIFDGTVAEYKRGKENPVDTYLEINAGDGDQPMNREVFMAQYGVGTKDKQIIMDAAKALGMKVKYIDPDIGTEATQRDQTIIEPARQKLRELMLKYGARFMIEHGELIMIKNGKSRDGEAVVLTPRTGLVNLPEVTPQGIVAQCLLNPQIRPGGKIKISTDVLSGVPFTPGSTVKVGPNGTIEDSASSTPGAGAAGPRNPAALWGAQLDTAFTSPQGIYKVVLLEHTGDTRGDPWYCNITGIALDEKGNIIDNPANAYDRLATSEVTGGAPVKAPPPGAPKRLAA